MKPYLFRVVLHWSYNQMSFTCERGVKAESAGQALDWAAASARLDRCGNHWKAFVEIATGTDSFSDPYSLTLPVIGSRGETVGEFFQ